MFLLLGWTKVVLPQEQNAIVCVKTPPTVELGHAVAGFRLKDITYSGRDSQNERCDAFCEIKVKVCVEVTDGVNESAKLVK